MRKCTVFNNVTLDGYFTDAKGDMSWAHKNDPEWTAFTRENAKGQCVMVFGRITYEMMAGWWPSPQAKQMMPAVADSMNNAEKLVFSRTLDRATWSNTRLVKEDLPGTIRKLKEEDGPALLIMGSGSVIAQLAQENLIDEYQLALAPVALGKGRTMFDGVKKKLDFKLTESRAFSNGNVFLRYVC